MPSVHRSRSIGQSAGAWERPPRAARSVAADWRAIVRSSTRPDLFTADLISGLPEPAQRWLLHAIAPDAPLFEAVRLTSRGRIDLRGWRPFRATQVLSRRGFVWSATAVVAGVPVTGYDLYRSGRGEMRWRLLALAPVMTASGTDVTRSAAGRWAAEIVSLLPTVFRSATWTSGADPDTAVASWPDGDRNHDIALTIGSTGQLRQVALERWGNPDGTAYRPCRFVVTAKEERTFGPLTMMSAFSAAWQSGDQRNDFFEAEITEASFR